MTNPVVTTSAGMVEGVDVGRRPLRIFRGIPYAEPPVGARRFRPPFAVRPWSGIRPALAFGPAAPQPPDRLMPGMTPDLIGEDCLSLTVWAPPAGPEPLPVLVWIHGGAFMTGSSSSPTYDCARLAAEQDVVVVSINYRLGVLGFLDLRGRGGDQFDAEPNCGLLDQLLALEWVQDNVAAFGGDPARVTIFGESAGAGSVLHLLGTGGIGRLARRAIAQSPGVHFTLDPDQADIVAAAVLKALGISSPDLARLYELPWEALLEAQSAALTEVVGVIGAMPFHPVVDGRTVRRRPLGAIEAGAAAGVDLLIGCTSEEMRLLPDPRSRHADRDQLVQMASGLLAGPAGRRLGVSPARAGELVDVYANGSASPEEAWTGLLTDGMMRLPAMQVADAHSRWPAPTFSYLFTWPAPGLGACHAIDLPFTFGTFDVDGWEDFVGADADAHELSRRLRQAWAGFAAHGDPSTTGLGGWPQYGPVDRHTMVLGHQCGVVTDPLGDIRRLWDPDPVSTPGLLDA